MSRKQLLDSGWAWKQRDTAITSVLDDADGWTPAQTSPSEIHVELLKNGEIPDPYIGFNEHQVQWVGKVEWLYKCDFAFAPKEGETHAELEFLGLDTLCDVYFNGIQILASENEFQTHIVPLDLASLKPENNLVLHFKSAHLRAKELEAEMGRVRAGSTNLGDPSRVYVRKAQYDWRWDWGPELMTCGPYRPITLKTYSACIAEVHAKALLSQLNGPSLEVDATLAGTFDSLVLAISIADAGGTVLKSETIPAGGAASWDLAGLVDLWWPVGYGAQTLYSVSIALQDASGQTLDTSTTRVGFRRIRLVQDELTEPDQYGTGTTFFFEVNGVRMFMGGSNFVPADNFLTTITPERYRAWLTLLRDGNQNMVRLWGGGVYEPDVFYDICDELGILVWQDFQFACGVYPAHDSFVASVRKEAEDNVKRLRHHPSIALFCGNNEDYQMVLQWGDVKDFPAIKIYEEVLPSVVEALTGPQTIAYWRGSPYGGKGWDTSDPTIGDVHQWNIWGGKELPYQQYESLGGRFVSEFGLPGHPSMNTVKYWMGDAPAEQWYAQSPLIAQHVRAGLFERRFAILMNDMFRTTEDLETYVYNTQILQSEGVGFAYQAWRRQWAGPGKEYTSGVLVWQLNDCWPVTSWAIADYFLRPKPVYYTIARQLAPITINVSRTVIKNRDNDKPRQYYDFSTFLSYGAKVDIWGTNATLEPRKATLEITAFDLLTPWKHTETHSVTLLPNQATELLTGIPCPGPPKEIAAPTPCGDEQYTTTYSVVVAARLLDPQSGAVLARFADWPQPFRFLQSKMLAEPGLVVDVNERDGDGEAMVSVNAEKPVKGLVLSVLGEGPDVKFSDNALDIVPGDAQVVKVRGLNGRKVAVAFLGQEKAREL
ncbi:hypothetical protein MKEN_01445000 [Mycena kentingensis (nom. inval.)]|nr:hypothetical protein MKEN_01445000 [Mycena kentingensis (nom. inval.)]